MTPLVLVGTALGLGALHALGPDHLAAVSVFVGRRPSWRRAAGIGARWAFGHSLTIIVLGGAVVLTGLQLPPGLTSLAERLVGLTLIALGVLALARAQRLHGHWHDHDGSRHWHVHAHGVTGGHDHGHAALVGIGMLHGLAGSGALVVAIPATGVASPAHAMAFLAAFGVGTVIAMVLFTGAAGLALATAATRSAPLHRAALALAGLATVAVGAWWLAAGGAS